MTDDHLTSIIAKHKLQTGANSTSYKIAQTLFPMIRSWAGGNLIDIQISGSHATDTAVKGSADIDLFISLDYETPGTLQEVYEKLFTRLTQENLSQRKQNVSIGIDYQGIHIDFIPARKYPGNTNDHNLWRNKVSTWTKTNIQTHINLITNSGRLDEIRLMKIWRNLHNLEFPSFFLELMVLDALYGKSKDQLDINFQLALQYVRDKITTTRIVDPANGENIISNDLSDIEKQLVANAAAQACAATSWATVVW